MWQTGVEFLFFPLTKFISEETTRPNRIWIIIESCCIKACCAKWTISKCGCHQVNSLQLEVHSLLQGRDGVISCDAKFGWKGRWTHWKESRFVWFLHVQILLKSVILTARKENLEPHLWKIFSQIYGLFLIPWAFLSLATQLGILDLLFRRICNPFPSLGKADPRFIIIRS